MLDRATMEGLGELADRIDNMRAGHSPEAITSTPRLMVGRFSYLPPACDCRLLSAPLLPVPLFWCSHIQATLFSDRLDASA